MSKLYELEISDENINELLDIDGDIDALKFLRAGPNEMVEAIEDIIDIYDRSAWGILSDIFRHQKSSLAWAYIFLDREYAVAEVVREKLDANSGITFSNYSVLYDPKFPNDLHSIGYIRIKDKASLAKLADTSVLWAECWRVLADVSADAHSVSILDPLPKSWSYHHENSKVLNVWHEAKVHAAPKGKSHGGH
jgi:hypothetical protein